MKKLLATLIALMMLVSAAVCGAVAETADIIGEWYGSIFGLSMTMTLHEDGTYTMSMAGEEADSGTWSFDGTTLTTDEGTDGEAAFAATQVKTDLAGTGQQHLGPVTGTLLGIVDDGVGKETPAFVEVLGFACAHGLAFRWVSRRCGRIPRLSRAPVL